MGLETFFYLLSDFGPLIELFGWKGLFFVCSLAVWLLDAVYRTSIRYHLLERRGER